LSGRGLCDELITRPEESYRLWCVVVCDLETSRMGAPCIYDISTLRVKGRGSLEDLGEDGRILLNRSSRDKMVGCGLNSSGSGYREVTVRYEHGNGPSFFFFFLDRPTVQCGPVPPQWTFTS